LLPAGGHEKISRGTGADRVRALRDEIESAIFRRLGASAASPVDPKHWRDAKTLADLCGRARRSASTSGRFARVAS
jgi:hypothetical protein